MGAAAENLISWDLLLRESWTRGEISWKLRPEQREFKYRIEESHKQLVVANISRRWGKSFTLVLYVIEQCIKSRQNIRYGAAFKTDLEEFILPAFEYILQDCPEDLRPRWLGSKKVWLFPNGSRIKLVGLDKNRNGLRGNAMNIIVIDEGGFVVHLRYQYQSVIIPATMKQKNIKILVASTPPESPEHFFVKLIDKAKGQDNGFYIEMDIDTISDLEPDERKRMLDEVGGEDSPTARREFFCEIRIDETRAIAPKFDEKLHVTDYDPENVHWMIFGDTAAKDKTVFLRMGYDHETGWIIVREEYNPPTMTPTKQVIQGYKERWKDNYILTLDASEQLRLDYAAEELPSQPPMTDDFDAGILLMNNFLYKNKVVIHRDCDLLIRTLRGGLKTQNLNDFERSEELGHCDAAASFIYGLRGVDTVTDLRPRPSKFEVFELPKKTQVDQNIEGLTAWESIFR